MFMKSLQTAGNPRRSTTSLVTHIFISLTWFEPCHSIQVNHLSTALLSLLMLPHLLKTTKSSSITPRLVIVSSEVHYLTNISKIERDSPDILEKLSDKEYCTPSFVHPSAHSLLTCLFLSRRVMSSRYFVSKLLNIFFTRALNAHLPLTGSLIVNAVNPGYCLTNFGRSPNRPLTQRVMGWILDKTVAHTSEEGSRQLVYAAVGGKTDEKNMRGAYISGSRVDEVSDFVLSAEGTKVQDRIWVCVLTSCFLVRVNRAVTSVGGDNWDFVTSFTQSAEHFSGAPSRQQHRCVVT